MVFQSASARFVRISSKSPFILRPGRNFLNSPNPLPALCIISRNKTQNSIHSWSTISTVKFSKSFTKFVILSFTFIYILFTSYDYVTCQKEDSTENTESDKKEKENSKRTKNPSKKLQAALGSSDKTKGQAVNDSKIEDNAKDKESEFPKFSHKKGAADKPDDLPNEKERLLPMLENAFPVTLKYAQHVARTWLNLRMAEYGAPGLSVSVSINGKTVWAEGLGYADVENQVRCSPQSVMRIASISKSMTAVAASLLCEQGALDLDAPIQKYVPDFPIKKFNNKEVTITTRHLLSHTSGIRHYLLKEEKEVKKEGEVKKEEEVIHRDDITATAKQSKREEIRNLLADLAYPIKKEKLMNESGEFDLEEYYIKEKFKSIKQSLELFKDDDLLFEPGQGFNYTTHGYTLLSAVIEGASGKNYKKVMKDLFYNMSLVQTLLENDDAIVYNRAKYFIRNKYDCKLKNAPYVNNSYKYAGGGILSTVKDLSRFGNALLYSYQHQGVEGKAPGILKSSSVKEMWTPIPGAQFKDSLAQTKYGLGWDIVEEKLSHPFCRKHKFMCAHSGGAIGASSYLLIYPTQKKNKLDDVQMPQGIVVTVLCNLQNAHFSDICQNIAFLFDRVEDQSNVLGSISGSNAKVYKACNSKHFPEKDYLYVSENVKPCECQL